MFSLSLSLLVALQSAESEDATIQNKEVGTLELSVNAS